MSKARKLNRVFGDLDQLHAAGQFDALDRQLRSRKDLPASLGNDGELRHLPTSLGYYQQFIEGRRLSRRSVALDTEVADSALGSGLAHQLAEVCRLQPSYSSENSPAMQRRGELIRSEIPASLRGISDRLREALGGHGLDIGIGASDGIGRKKEAPWVRIYSNRLSPTPRDGFYVVIHFAAGGEAVFVTVGCGSTIWANGDLRSVSDAELNSRTQWARDEVVRAKGSLAPFTDEIALGAKASLPRTFEKATAFAKRVARAELANEMVEDLVVAAVERLAVIYDAQDIGADLSEPDQIELELEGRGGRRRGEGQGFGLTAPEKKAVEDCAMAMAKAWLESAGFVPEDTSKSAPYDFVARREGETFKIEVKGTTSELGDVIMVTKNELELHRKELGQTGLIVVSAIKLDRSSNPPTASGGQLAAELGWNIDDWDAAPIAYRLTRKSKA
jgi:hypothetical protein